MAGRRRIRTYYVVTLLYILLTIVKMSTSVYFKQLEEEFDESAEFQYETDSEVLQGGIGSILNTLVYLPSACLGFLYTT